MPPEDKALLFVLGCFGVTIGFLLLLSVLVRMQ